MADQTPSSRTPHYRDLTPRPRPTDPSPSDCSGGRGGLLLTAGLVGAAVAGVAVARRLGRDTPPLYRSLPARPQEYAWGDHRVVFYEGGPADGEPVLLVHGPSPAASARDVSALFEALGRTHRVTAYDLLGFGASARPDVSYDAQLYTALMRDVLHRVIGRPAHVVAVGVSGAHALDLAATDPEAVRSLAVVNPPGLLARATQQGPQGRLLQTLLRLPFLGEALFNLLVSRPALARCGCYAGDLDHSYQTAHQHNARLAPAAYLGDALDTNTYMALRTLEVPTLALWSGGEDALDRERQAFAGVCPKARIESFEDAGADLLAERPGEVAAVLSGWFGEH